MGGKDDRPIVWNLVKFIDEDRSKGTQPVDHETIVDDFVPDINWRPKARERELDDLDCSVDAGAKSARRCDEDDEAVVGSASGQAM